MKLTAGRIRLGAVLTPIADLSLTKTVVFMMLAAVLAQRRIVLLGDPERLSA